MSDITFTQVVSRGCGMDIHKEVVVATVRGEGIKQETRSFKTFTSSLTQLREWLLDCKRPAHQERAWPQEVSAIFPGIDMKSRLKRFVFAFIVVPAKWVRVARQWTLNIYTKNRWLHYWTIFNASYG